MAQPRKLSFRRFLVGGALLASGGIAFQVGTGCASFAGEQTLVATDFCFIFDCAGGALGGTIQPCQGAVQPTEDLNNAAVGHFPLFVDCFGAQP